MSPTSKLQSDNSKQRPATYTWQVENFENRMNDYYCSKPFASPDNPVLQFQLYLYPKRERILWNDDGTVIVLYVTSKDTDDEHQILNLKYRISIVDSSGFKCHTSESTTKFSSRKAILNGQYSISRDCLLDPDNGLLLDESLTIYCEVQAYESKINLQMNSETNSLSNTKHVIYDYAVLDDYQLLLEKGNFADAILLAGTGESYKEFPVHKAILVARSSFFAAMFEHSKNKKAQENMVKIDMPVQVFAQVLKYIYTGSVQDLDMYSVELMKAANKYQLDNLKCICEQYLCSNLSTDSVANILLVAEMHQSWDLKNKCVEYIIEHGKEAMATEGWRKLTTAKPELSFELLQYYLSKQ